MGLKSPGPAELIRSSQRDKEFIKRLKEDVDEMILEVFGQRVWMRWQEYSQYGSSIIYYALTNLMGSQTLGEEYVGVIQVDSAKKAIPSTKAISLMIFTQVLGTPFISYVIKMIENFKQRQAETATLPKYLNDGLSVLLRFGQLIQHFSPMLSQLHLAAFYVNGKFYEISKRLSGIHYILIRNYLGNDDASSKRNLKYLMWMSILNLAITTAHDSYTYVHDKLKETHNYQLPSTLRQASQGGDERRSSSVSDDDPTKKCSLCLDVRRHCSVTPCGHLFCWECIIDWLRSEGACPICREAVTPARVVPLQNLT